MSATLKSKILNLLLIITSLMGYLEWPPANRLFLFQAEAEIFKKMFENPTSEIHPFTILPFIGQILLIITLFQIEPGKKMTYAAIGCIGILLILMFVIGCLSLNFKILTSTLPFLVVAFLTIRHHLKKE